MNTHRVSQDLELIPVQQPSYPIGCPDHLKPRPLGLDQQGRFPDAAHAASEFHDDDACLGWGAFLPVALALALVGTCAALVLLLK